MVASYLVITRLDLLTSRLQLQGNKVILESLAIFVQFIVLELEFPC